MKERLYDFARSESIKRYVKNVNPTIYLFGGNVTPNSAQTTCFAIIT
jgi:hypothetical protein